MGTKVGGGHNMNINVQKSTNKTFKKWFKKEIGADFLGYYDFFVNSGFDDLRTIRHIHHEQELIDLGIHKKGHRLHILDKIENYRLSQQANHDDANIAMPAGQKYDASPIQFNQNDDEGNIEMD